MRKSILCQGFHQNIFAAQLILSVYCGALMLGIFQLNLNGAVRHLKVSENKHFLVYEDGKPFFYLGDTAWELFHRLNREDAE